MGRRRARGAVVHQRSKLPGTRSSSTRAMQSSVLLSVTILKVWVGVEMGARRSDGPDFARKLTDEMVRFKMVLHTFAADRTSCNWIQRVGFPGAPRLHEPRAGEALGLVRPEALPYSMGTRGPQLRHASGRSGRGVSDKPSGPQFLSRRTSAPGRVGLMTVSKRRTSTAVPTHKVDGPLKELGNTWIVSTS